MKNILSITIGIPAYNEEENIGHLLSSLILQERKGFKINEIIVISDGSTDKTSEQVMSINNKLIRLIEGKNRKGQNIRQNEIIKSMSKRSDCLLLIEADILPKDSKYISRLVEMVPYDKRFSLITGSFVPIPTGNLFAKIIIFGFELRSEFFKANRNGLSLYLCNGPKLLSKDFLKTFLWSENFHEDSYCYREALKSDLEIYRNPSAIAYYRSAENFNDYLIQSGKFQKAKDKEDSYSDIYKLNVSYVEILKIIQKFFFRNPFMFTSYISLVLISRIYSQFLPRYTVFWKIYKSTKKGF
ncbi:MAG: glycosyltransferase [Candidatus Daviesbacteria bacterium]|nr:glycosyltransferase [Candidatus Daviesbacteria bacterium]